MQPLCIRCRLGTKGSSEWLKLNAHRVDLMHFVATEWGYLDSLVSTKQDELLSSQTRKSLTNRCR